jgi:hypothetical protein
MYSRVFYLLTSHMLEIVINILAYLCALDFSAGVINDTTIYTDLQTSMSILQFMQMSPVNHGCMDIWSIFFWTFEEYIY